MIALLLTPFYILFNVYIVRWLLCYMGACHILFQKKITKGLVIGVYTFLTSSILLAFLMPASPLKRFLKLISNYWLGTFLYILLTVLIADLIRHILMRLKFRYSHKIFCRRGFIIGGTLSIAVIIMFSVTGIMGAANLQVTDYQLSINKECDDMDRLKVVLVADMHLGYSIGVRRMENMVEKINSCEPDLVVIAGDIFDNEYEALDNPDRLADILSGIESRYGVYACYGNHDIDEKLLAGFTLGGRKEDKASAPEMDEFLDRAGIQLLRDEGALINNSFYIFGRPDYKKPGRDITERMTPEEITSEMDRTKPIIIIDHEPKELTELAEAGVDLDLCGHTHDGQMFPGNLVTRLMWENSCGYLRKGNMHSIVTSGVGVFGPAMRVGTKSEICVIDITFK